ncbi:stimulated by retinoic acid gene 6 protein-like [Mizuhopecten yessoensis]|uniref:stimulated by retinoic acid gene 6 protein-like n=1 Tax=Mizuhopecten yessoensis TaxID=6573 RepID=UPI000B458C95|nr:stimulated by retinoic acid gene 6 protein-like [Mizuhopecten yessoensis]
MANTMSTATSLTSNTTSSSCIEELLYNSYLRDAYVAVIAIGLMFVLPWFEKRRNTSQTGCFGGRPGCLIPVNLLDGDRDRLSYAAAFGCTSSSIFNLLATSIRSQISTTSEQLSALVFYLWIMASAVVIGITYYPLFVCLAPRFRFVHSTIGLGYAIVCLVKSLLPMKDYIECLPTSEWIVTMTLIMLAIPQSLCLFYLALRFLCMLATDVKTTIRACRQRDYGLIHGEQVPTCTNKSDRLANSKQIQHVRELFMRTDEPTTSG